MTVTTDKSNFSTVDDFASAEEFMAAVDATIKPFNDGDIVEGIVVKVSRDEVLVDIGYKTEGIIPSRELSIKHDIDPNEVVTVGDVIEALVLQKEDKEGQLILSKSAHSTNALGDQSKRSRKKTASLPALSSKSSRAA